MRLKSERERNPLPTEKVVGIDQSDGKDTSAYVQSRIDASGKMHVERMLTVINGDKKDDDDEHS